MTAPVPEAGDWSCAGYAGGDHWNRGRPGDGLGVVGWQEHDPYRDAFRPFGSTAEEAWPCRGESPSGPPSTGDGEAS
ncbi:hypothetical protein ACFQ78_33455 [Streptomyces sp. NPDC056519]|uniref:hypothetical protein n=1 Tax=Streptomyces sp. NPDC056519 TaxID=3345849 RepID=UPI00369D0A08